MGVGCIAQKQLQLEVDVFGRGWHPSGWLWHGLLLKVTILQLNTRTRGHNSQHQLLASISGGVGRPGGPGCG